MLWWGEDSKVVNGGVLTEVPVGWDGMVIN